MSSRLTKHKDLYDKLMAKDNVIPETREEAFDLALILTLKGESYTGIVSDSKWNSSKHAQLLKQIMDGENVVPETRDEAVKLAIIRNHNNGISGIVTDEQIASAVSAYLKENPVSSGLTEEEVNTLIQSAIGNAMGGEY